MQKECGWYDGFGPMRPYLFPVSAFLLPWSLSLFVLLQSQTGCVYACILILRTQPTQLIYVGCVYGGDATATAYILYYYIYVRCTHTLHMVTYGSAACVFYMCALRLCSGRNTIFPAAHRHTAHAHANIEWVACICRLRRLRNGYDAASFTLWFDSKTSSKYLWAFLSFDPRVAVDAIDSAGSACVCMCVVCDRGWCLWSIYFMYMYVWTHALACTTKTSTAFCMLHVPVSVCVWVRAWMRRPTCSLKSNNTNAPLCEWVKNSHGSGVCMSAVSSLTLTHRMTLRWAHWGQKCTTKPFQQSFWLRNASSFSLFC